jgi:hypothetical protein
VTMTDVDIFAKLSRILETHTVGDGDAEDADVLQLLQRIEKDGSKEDKMGGTGNGKSNRTKIQTQDYAASVGDRPSPYDVWESKQAGIFQFENKEKPKLSEQQWDRLVNNLHSTNKLKDSSTKEQNQGLAHELGGLSFRPKMNAVSMVLASTMKSLQQRLPGMINKRNQALDGKREAREKVSGSPADAMQCCLLCSALLCSALVHLVHVSCLCLTIQYAYMPAYPPTHVYIYSSPTITLHNIT